MYNQIANKEGNEIKYGNKSTKKNSNNTNEFFKRRSCTKDRTTDT